MDGSGAGFAEALEDAKALGFAPGQQDAWSKEVDRWGELPAAGEGASRNITAPAPVLDLANRDVIGCVYIYPLPDSDYDACALSWVRESHAHLDTPLWRAVSEWLESDWPFAGVEYAPRA